MDKEIEFALDKWLTTSEVARLLRISKGHVLNLVSQGKIKAHKFGVRNLYLITEIEKLIKPPTAEWVKTENYKKGGCDAY